MDFYSPYREEDLAAIAGMLSGRVHETGPRFGHDYMEEGLTVIDEVLDLVRTSRGQLGTLSHMSEDLEHSVAGLRAALEGVLSFFSERRNITLVAVSVIVAASLLNHLRGWVSARSLRGWFYTFGPELTPAGSSLHRFARDMVRSRSRRRQFRATGPGAYGA